MTNPFEAFNISDDEDEGNFQKSNDTKVKRTHQEKKNYKKQQQEVGDRKVETSNVVTQALPEHVRENAKQVRNPRHPPTPVTKELHEGHYHDRRSGTGRVDKVRKEGGGKGNVGNIKDDLNQDKYIKENEGENKEENKEGTIPTEEPPKPVEPEALTLEQYYKNKGIEINNTFEKKVQPKKADIQADWIKKEKLTVLETKQDKKANEKTNAQGLVKFNTSKAGLDENLLALGFGSKPAAQKQEHRDYKDTKGGEKNYKPEYKGGKKASGKAVVKEEDFPTL